MNIRLKVTISTIIVVLCICVLIVLFPLPTRLDKNIPCVSITTEDTTVENFMFTIDGWHLHYLLKKDRLKVNFELSSAAEVRLLYGSMLVDINQNGPIQYCNGLAYHVNANQMIAIKIEFMDDFSNIFIDCQPYDPGYCVGSAEPILNPHEILNSFQSVVIDNS